MLGHREIYDEEHALLRESARRFARDQILPNETAWRESGCTGREVWTKAGNLGLLCPQVPLEYDGAGLSDYRYQAVLAEELNSSSVGFGLQTGIAVDYILNFGSDAQKRSLLPGMVRGELIVALAMSEPNAGSDLASIRTSATRKGDRYIINGQKTFISSGQLCDAVIVACKTDPAAGARGISLILVEATAAGFRRGRNLKKLGRHGADTSELFFDDVEVPLANLLGKEHGGFAQLMKELPKERLGIALSGIVDATRAFEMTLDHVRQRIAFGRKLFEFQNTRFQLAGARAQLEAGWALVDRCIVQQTRGALSADVAAMAKLWVSEMQGTVIDTCLQLFGGYGYMDEYEICRLYADARAQRLYGGSSEIMREVIARSIGES